jgi:hypothetical protein
MAKSVTMLLLVSLGSLSTVAWAKKHLMPVKVQVVAESEGLQGKFQQGGVTGVIGGVRTFATATLTTAIINGDHALLKCYENRSGCNILGAAEYDAEMRVKEACKHCSESESAPDIWIFYVRPVDHKTFREHWRVVGSW